MSEESVVKGQFQIHVNEHRVTFNSNTVGDSKLQLTIDETSKSDLAPFAYLDKDTPLLVTIESI